MKAQTPANPQIPKLQRVVPRTRDALKGEICLSAMQRGDGGGGIVGENQPALNVLFLKRLHETEMP